MNVGSICTRHVVTVDGKSTLAQAACLMRDHHVGALVVTTRSPDGVRVNGIVTDRDLVIDVLARGMDNLGISIGALAKQTVARVFEDDGIDTAIAAMQANGVRRLLVADERQRLVGLVSFDDLTSACATQIGALAQVLDTGIQREVAQSAELAVPGPLLLDMLAPTAPASAAA